MAEPYASRGHRGQRGASQRGETVQRSVGDRIRIQCWPSLFWVPTDLRAPCRARGLCEARCAPLPWDWLQKAQRKVWET